MAGFTRPLTYDDGHDECGQFDSEIGVRTDDVIVVGWINPAGVTLPAGSPPIGPSAWILGIMPPTGPPVPSSLSCNDLVADLSFADITPNGNPLVGADRMYILHWLFKYAGNTNPSLIIPGGDFRNAADTSISETEVSNFVGVKTNFKLFNRLQIKFRADQSGFITQPIPLKHTADIGSTTNPCGTVMGVLGIFGGQQGPSNSTSPTFGPRHVVSINDGSPDAGAVRAFDTLTSVGVSPNVLWENIGSSIQLAFDGGTTPNIVVQPYPTYYVFLNGHLVNVIPQAAVPIGNFVSFPYPFGTVPCSQLMGLVNTIPGGRCGDAESPADPTARVPSYIVIPP